MHAHKFGYEIMKYNKIKSLIRSYKKNININDDK
jgi:hypothetical protein